jgi:hypothetical protein
MKTVDVDQFAANVDQYVVAARSETIVLTQAGRPCAVVHGVDYDDEQLELINSPEFWSMIRERRSGPTIPWNIAKEQLKALPD